MLVSPTSKIWVSVTIGQSRKLTYPADWEEMGVVAEESAVRLIRRHLIMTVGVASLQSQESLPRWSTVPAQALVMLRPRGAVTFRTPAELRRAGLADCTCESIYARAGSSEAVLGETATDWPRLLDRLCVGRVWTSALNVLRDIYTLGMGKIQNRRQLVESYE